MYFLKIHPRAYTKHQSGAYLGRGWGEKEYRVAAGDAEKKQEKGLSWSEDSTMP